MRCSTTDGCHKILPGHRWILAAVLGAALVLTVAAPVEGDGSTPVLAPAPEEDDAPLRGWLRVLGEIQVEELADLYRAEAARRRIEAAGVALGTWHRVGPFRDQPPLLNWMENVASSFARRYGAETDTDANGGSPLLGKVYRAGNFPATPRAERRWTAHREWIDGYLCDLPRGPAPSAGESQYVYRLITAKKPVTIELEFAVRSPESDRRQEAPNMETWRRQARYRCSLNGENVILYDGKGRVPTTTRLTLKPGANHFFAKITNNRHSYGFSFAIVGLHPAPRRPGAHERPWRPFRSYRASDLPYYREGNLPAWFVGGEDWRESLYASAAAFKARSTSPDATGQTIWSSLQREYADAQSRLEIELTRAANDLFWSTYLKNGDRAETETALAGLYLKELTAMVSRSGPELLEILRTGPSDDDYAGKVRDAYFTASHYREGLHRIKSFRFVHSPMPGIEAAARDSGGRTVTEMEVLLERYPPSTDGKRRNERVEALGEEIEPLLKALVETGEPRLEKVLALSQKIEDSWVEAIRNLPPIIFLERPAYHYDALQFTRNGASPSYIRVLDPARKEVRTVFHSPTLRAHDMTLSWDAETVHIGGGGLVAEVGVDGEGYRVVTSGQSPTELPDGRIVFFDDAPGISPCKATGPRRLLFTVHRDGSHRKVASANLTTDTTPQIMNDGRVVFCRWDYGVNKNVFNRHGIWVQNPDSTGLDLFFGNTIIDPFAFYRPRPIPGRPEVVCIFGTHHNNNAGLVGLIWQERGREAGDGVGFQRITHDTASVGDACPHWAYQDPYPLNEQLFLVSYGGDAKRKVGIYLLDRFGNKKCVFEPSRNLGAYCPQPFVPRERPPSIPDRTSIPDWEPVDLREQLLTDPDWSQRATLVLQDVYQGIEPEIARGRVKHLAILEQVVHTTPRGGAIGVGTIFYVNRLIGLVPVEKDGSAHFEVPALRSIYFQALDSDGKMLMTMGSDMHCMPGEQRGCIGCHVYRKTLAAAPSAGRFLAAARKPPARPEMPDWGTRGIIEYEAVVQPVFDKYCVSCHSGLKLDGRLDLSGSRTTAYSMSYMELVDKGLVHFVPGTGRTHAQPSNGYDEEAPLSRGSLLSRLTPYLDDPEHCGTEIPWKERHRVYCWIDANVPFYSHYRQMSPTILGGGARKELREAYDRRCARCHDRGPRKDAISWLSQYNVAVHTGPQPGQWGIAESGMRVRHLNLSHPDHSLALRAPLAESAGGLELCVDTDGARVFPSKDDPDYKRIHRALTEGVVFRDQPGVKELLTQREGRGGQ